MLGLYKFEDNGTITPLKLSAVTGANKMKYKYSLTVECDSDNNPSAEGPEDIYFDYPGVLENSSFGVGGKLVVIEGGISYNIQLTGAAKMKSKSVGQTLEVTMTITANEIRSISGDVGVVYKGGGEIEAENTELGKQVIIFQIKCSCNEPVVDTISRQ